jgi:hypothetical protein
MKKRLLQLIIAILIALPGAMAQTVSMPALTVNPGQVLVPVSMTGFSNVAAITLEIVYDAQVLSFVGIQNQAIPGNWYANYNGNKLVITYQATPYGTGYPMNGQLLNINFNYLGGFATPLTFGNGCSIANQYLQTYSTVTYVNGSVSPLAGTGNVSLSQETASPTSDVALDVTMQGAGFSDVKAFTYKIGYDPAKLTFAQVLNSVLGGTLTASANSGVVTITWTGTSQNLSASTNVFDVKFVYNGGGTADVTFEPGCQVSNSSLALIPVTYVDGEVQEATGTTSLDIADVIGTQGNVETVPLTLGAIAGGGYLGSMTLKIAYDNTKLTYTGFNYGTITSGISATALNGVVTVTWTKSNNTTNLTGVIMSLKFMYNTTLAVPITFAPGCVLTRTNLSNITMAYTDGSIMSCNPSIGTQPSNANIVYGANAVFTVTASNVCYYQWQVNTGSGWVDLANNAVYSGVATASLTVTAPTLAYEAYSYRCVLGPSTNTNVVSIVFSPATIGTQPVDYTADLEGLWSFTCVGSNYVSFEWQVYPVGGPSWIAIPPVTSTIGGSIDGNYSANGVKFRCVFQPGNVISDEATLYVNPLTVNAKVFLQGAYMYCMPTMCTELYNYSLIPTTQPYNVAPWNYAGTEEWTDPLPTNAVDWVLVELRSDINDADFITQKAGMLLSDGSIVDTDGGLLKFPGYDMDNYYVVITHRNHLPIMSATAIPLQSQSVLYDFTTSDSQSYFDAGIGGTPLADNGDGTWSMFAGDGNGDGFVDVIDLVDIYFVEVDTDGYLSGDWNLDQYCDVIDLVDVYFINVDIMSHVPLY